MPGGRSVAFETDETLSRSGGGVDSPLCPPGGTVLLYGEGEEEGDSFSYAEALNNDGGVQWTKFGTGAGAGQGTQ